MATVMLSPMMANNTSSSAFFSWTVQPNLRAKPAPKHRAASMEEKECLPPPLVHVTRNVTGVSFVAEAALGESGLTTLLGFEQAPSELSLVLGILELSSALELGIDSGPSV